MKKNQNNPGKHDHGSLPDGRGHYALFGGRYVPETVIPALQELEAFYDEARRDPVFQAELDSTLATYAGRPSPLYLAGRMSADLGGIRVYLKREDLNHTGSHKINNTLGQVLLAKRMGKHRVIAETGAGQHGVATATAAAKLGLECSVYMGKEDTERQSLNVFLMGVLGAKVIPVVSGTCTLKDAINEALRDWVTQVRDTHYVIGSVVGPHPYPMMVRAFQSVIGREAREQILALEGRLPDRLIACVGGGSNAMGLFHPFLEDDGVSITGVEAGGLGIESGQHGASLEAGEVGVLHGACTYVLQDDGGQIHGTHSVSAGLDYPGVGPELSYLKEIGRLQCDSVTDTEALAAYHYLARTEGILPALESAHAIAYLRRIAGDMSPGEIVVVNLSGRGDKDVDIISKVSSP